MGGYGFRMLPPPPDKVLCVLSGGRNRKPKRQNGTVSASPTVQGRGHAEDARSICAQGCVLLPVGPCPPPPPSRGHGGQQKGSALHYAGAGNMLARAGAQRRGERTVPTPRAKPCTALGNRLARLRTRLKVPTTQSEEQKTRIQKRPCKERFNSPSCEKPRFLFRPVRQLSPSRP